ncbi:hypothetical protein RRG08_038268 [Elysia crispata]|uniref:Uncharacterized protein n=1 Tax=Elysia crispata TaxID=231223 RepID=A0AAE1AMW8_9GAST|nr:hypothetical protein RRG08_038268 [Elysia crispata]
MPHQCSAAALLRETQGKDAAPPLGFVQYSRFTQERLPRPAGGPCTTIVSARPSPRRRGFRFLKYAEKTRLSNRRNTPSTNSARVQSSYIDLGKFGRVCEIQVKRLSGHFYGRTMSGLVGVCARKGFSENKFAL